MKDKERNLQRLAQADVIHSFNRKTIKNDVKELLSTEYRGFVLYSSPRH